MLNKQLSKQRSHQSEIWSEKKNDTVNLTLSLVYFSVCKLGSKSRICEEMAEVENICDILKKSSEEIEELFIPC